LDPHLTLDQNIVFRLVQVSGFHLDLIDNFRTVNSRPDKPGCQVETGGERDGNQQDQNQGQDEHSLLRKRFLTLFYNDFVRLPVQILSDNP
jgi:hypothetical protein